MKLAIFSTCHAKAYEDFGRRYIEQFVDHMPEEIDLHVFTDGWEPDVGTTGRATRVQYHRIGDVEILQNFLEQHQDDAAKCGIVAKDGVPKKIYRHDAVSYSHVVYPLARFIGDGPFKGYDWVVRLDMDVEFKSDVPMSFWEELLEDRYTAVYLGRQDWPHSETGFVAYNLNKDGDLLIDMMIDCYATGRIFNLQGQTDCDVFDHVRDQMEDKDYVFKNLSAGCPGMHVWPQTVLAQHMVHHKGPAAKYGVEGLNDLPKSQIDQAAHTIASFKPRTIVDVGVFDGQRLVNFAKASLWAQRSSGQEGVVHAWAMDPGAGMKEHALQALEELAIEDSGFTYTYVNQDEEPELWAASNAVQHPKLGALTLCQSDFAYVDGDHAVESLQYDLFEMLKDVKLVLTPTYFLPAAAGSCQNVVEVGCNTVLGPEAQFKLLPVVSTCQGGGLVRTAAFGLAMSPEQGKGLGGGPRIRTKNAVPDEEIIENVNHSIQFQEEYAEEKGIEGKRRVPFANRCKIHDWTALIIGGGPSINDPEHPNYEKNWKAINKWIKKRKVKAFVVKTTHDHMIHERGEVPYGCFLLDPRDHVQNFISDPHPEVTYFVASMCHPTTWNLLVEKAKKLIGYHAVVQAGEVDHVGKVLKFRKAAFFGGGSSAASRGIGVLHGMGFRKFVFAGWDGHCWDAEVDMEEKDGDGKNKYIIATVEEKKYLTMPILLANIQDIQAAIKEHPDCEYASITEGLCKVMTDSLNQPKLDFFKDVANRA